MEPFDRPSAADVAMLARYLFGSRWQTALSQRLGVSRQVSYWAGPTRPVSTAFAERSLQGL